MSSQNSPADFDVRIDIWLWAARFFKTRSLVKQAIDTGKVEIDGQRCKPSRSVRVGDQLLIDKAGERFQIAVKAISDNRGPAAVAQLLYQESDQSKQAREALRAQRRAEHAGYQAPTSKPDKRARRLIRALGDLDAM